MTGQLCFKIKQDGLKWGTLNHLSDHHENSNKCNLMLGAKVELLRCSGSDSTDS